MKIYNSEPAGNEMANLEPARYFNLAIEQIIEIEQWLKSSKEVSQPLLVHIHMFVILGRYYPEMAKRRVSKLNINQIKETFYAWYERCNSKIPAKFREGIKQNADELFTELEQYGH